MPAEKIIYIIGFMGCGKSTAGRKLADRLGYAFVDLDEEIERIQQKSIKDIFADSGEDFFRETETKALRNLAKGRNIVVAAGGGAPCFSDNMNYMLGTGLVIYLKMTPLQLRDRLSRETGKRPLLKGLDSSDLLGFIEKKLAEREPVYLKAELIADGFNPDIRSLVRSVEDRFSKTG